MGQRRKGKPRAAPPSGLPALFQERAAIALGEEWPRLQEALETTPPVSIRLNPSKPGGPEGMPVPWCDQGRYLPERPFFTLDPLLHAGAYYVQEASSMLLEQALRASGLLDRPVLALDLCAAPGGKSTLIRSALHEHSLLVANEVDRKRQVVLKENLWKWGMPNVVVTGSDPSELERIPEFFDLIVVDAPCSGEGMFRKDPYAREQWNDSLVDHCASLQHDIVDHAWKALKPGGILIYSTCTWEQCEDEDRLRQLMDMGAEAIEFPVDPDWGVLRTGDEGTTSIRCYPHRLRGEGFFLAMVRKPGTLREWNTMVPTTTDHPEVRSWSNAGPNWLLSEKEDTLHAIDGRWTYVLQQLSSSLRVLAAGRPVAELKGGTWRPHPAMALDTTLIRGTFPEVDLDRRSALEYLHGQALRGEEPSGYALAVFNGVPLGWLKGAGTRWNNLWPNPWRIRMSGS